jgi:hypothetical protein
MWLDDQRNLCGFVDGATLIFNKEERVISHINS